MKKPVPDDFEITAKEYEQATKERARLIEVPPRQSFSEWTKCIVFFSSIGLAVVVGKVGGWLLTKGWGAGEGSGFLVGFISFWVIFIIWWHRLESSARRRQLKELSKPIYQKVQLYEDALERYWQKRERYWKSLRGRKFEKALARLYSDIGYTVRKTKGSGDEGVDLILWKDEKKMVVQCKGHEKPIGVSAIRDLYGAMMHFGADSAVLACPAGFTRGVGKFATDKPIQLVSATDLIKMVESVGNR